MNQTASQYMLERALKNAYGENSPNIIGFLTHEPIAQALNDVTTLDEAQKIERVKPAFRYVQSCAFIAQKIVGVKGSEGRTFNPVTALTVAVVAQAPVGVRIANSDMHHFVGARARDAQQVPGSNRQRLLKLLGSVTNVRTAQSMVSRTVGKSGFLTMLGITAKTDTNGFQVLNREHPFLVGYCLALESQTENQLQLIADEINATVTK